MPRSLLWFIFNLRIEKIRLNIYTACYICYILRFFFLIRNRKLIHTWVTKSCQHSREWSHPCLKFKADWFTFAHHMTWDAIESFPHWQLGLAVVRWLPRSCCRSKSQTEECINHTDTQHKLRQHQIPATIHSLTYLFDSIFKF